MGRLLIKPDGPVTSFFKAAGATLLAVGVPVVLRSIFFIEGQSKLESFGVSLLISVTLSVIAGVVWALRSVALRWAYDKVTGN
jgi:drug/metabolite transporter (DMT)-like permease